MSVCAPTSVPVSERRVLTSLTICGAVIDWASDLWQEGDRPEATDARRSWQAVAGQRGATAQARCSVARMESGRGAYPSASASLLPCAIAHGTN
jgi:hypothetical protein